jgi:hypothetical protein
LTAYFIGNFTFSLYTCRAMKMLNSITLDEVNNSMHYELGKSKWNIYKVNFDVSDVICPSSIYLRLGTPREYDSIPSSDL